MEKINIYIHIATMGEYQKIFDELFTKVIESNLVDISNKIFIGIVGDGELIVPKINNIVVKKIGNIEDYEFPTLFEMENDVYNDINNFKILYFNSLGATGNTIQKQSWRAYLSYFNIINHELCIKSLDTHDVCGVDWRTNPSPHYSGNFWWANSSYIKTLPKLDSLNKESSPRVLSVRHNAEMYIGMNNLVNPRVLWQSDISQYARHIHTYPENNYLGKVSNENIIIH